MTRSEAEPGSLASFLDTDVRLRDHAHRLYRWFWQDDPADNLPPDSPHSAVLSNRRRFEVAQDVSRLLTGGSAVADRWIEEDTVVDPNVCYRLESLADFIVFWRSRTKDQKLLPGSPPFPDRPAGQLFVDDLIDALMVAGMYAAKSGFCPNDGKHGLYDEPRYSLDWLNEEAKVPLWTRFDLLALASLTTVDHVGRCEGSILAHLSRHPDGQPEAYPQILRLVATWPEMEAVWDSLTYRGFDGPSRATHTEVLKRALSRRRVSGEIVAETRGKVSYWRMAE